MIQPVSFYRRENLPLGPSKRGLLDAIHVRQEIDRLTARSVSNDPAWVYIYILM